DANPLQPSIGIEQVAYRSVGVGNVVHANLASVVARFAAGFQDVEVGESEPMVLVVIGEEGESRIFVDHLRFEDVAIPRKHLIEAPGHVDDVSELHRLHHCSLLGRTTWTQSNAKPDRATCSAGSTAALVSVRHGEVSHPT